MKTKSFIALASIIITLSGCATATKFDHKLAAENTALIKDAVSIFLVSPNRATLKNVDGVETEYFSDSTRVSAGPHTLDLSCFIEISPFHIYGKNTIEAVLKAGHTYQLYPVLLPADSDHCEGRIRDETSADPNG